MTAVKKNDVLKYHNKYYKTLLVILNENIVLVNPRSQNSISNINQHQFLFIVKLTLIDDSSGYI